jgi:hypothetical protein
MWERDCRNIIETTIKILDSMDELNEVRKTLLKESALAKLTKEEKEVLGL